MKIKKSSWKFPFNRVSFKLIQKENEVYKVYNRNLTLTTKSIDKTFRCHKGKVIGKLLITSKHMGHKLGEFFITKILGERIAYRKKQKLLQKKNKNKQKQVLKNVKK